MRRTDGRRKDRNINEKDRQAQGMIKRRWRSKQSKRVAYRKRGKCDMQQKLQEAEETYQKDTNPKIRQIIDHLEEEALDELSDPSMEDWENYIPDPGHTRGRMSLYKQSIHVYWGVKYLLVKAMEQVASEMTEIIQGSPTLRKDLKNIQQNQIILDKKMDRIQHMLQASGLTVKKEKEDEMATKIP